MALIRCPQCGNPVSDKANSCPRCGHPIYQTAPNGYMQQPSSGNNNRWLYAIIGGLVLLTIILIIVLMSSGMCSRSTSTTQTSPTTSQSVEAPSTQAVKAEPAKEAEPAIDLNEDGTYHLSGKVAGVGCKMDITINGGSVYGTYSYNTQGKPLQLSGSKNGNHIYMGEEYEGEQTGELNGNINGNKFTGTHTRYKTGAETHFSFTAK